MYTEKQIEEWRFKAAQWDELREKIQDELNGAEEEEDVPDLNYIGEITLYAFRLA